MIVQTIHDCPQPRGTLRGAADHSQVYMNVLSPITTSPPVVAQTARKRRRYATSLLVGWFAFWLTAVIAPCCEGLVTNALAGQESTAIQPGLQGAAGGDHRSAPCPELTGARPAPPVFDAVSSDSTPRVAAGPYYSAAPFVPHTFEAAKHALSDRPPASVALRLRTSRLLI